MRSAEFYGMMQKTLRKVDLASMENSLEVRVPFLKKSFIEAALQIDPFLSYGPNRKKQVLKDLLRRELPKSPIDNRKRGFSVPLGQWMRQALKKPFEEVLLDANHHQQYGFRTSAIEHIWQEHQTGGRDNKWILFTLFSLFQWETNRTK
jgi:asparagine synthase (glutamine-hydrolysing)